MDQVRMGDDDSGPHPTESSATPLIQAEPSLLTSTGSESNAEDPAWPSPPPSTGDFHYPDKSWFSSLQSLQPKFTDLRFEPPRSKPLFRGFENPNFSRIAILTLLCLITYPAFHIVTLVANDKSLFVVRLIVNAWCSGGGFALGYVLLRIGAQHLEAATWATVIHMSHEGGGMKLRDLSRGSRNPTSFMPAFHIFRSRFGNRETSRRSRKSYDERPWSLFLAFFVVLAILGPLLPFVFGRIMIIETFVSNQRKVYREVVVAGDLSQDDLDKVTLVPVLSSQLYGESVPDTAGLVYGNDTVYFSQPSLSQLAPGGSGLGNLSLSVPVGMKDTLNNTLSLMGRNAPKSHTGTILRYPQWGIRVHCEKLPNPKVNLRASDGLTDAFIPQDFLRGLFGVYGIDLPMEYANPLLAARDTVPSSTDPSTISLTATFQDDGNGVSPTIVNTWDDDQGWVVVEAVLLRLYIQNAPNVSFPVHSYHEPSIVAPSSGEIGYDVGVCVHMYEPWIIEMYNSSIASPSALQIVGKGNSSTPLLPSGNIRGTPIANTRYLNTTGKTIAFEMALFNSIDTIKNENGRDGIYTNSPIAASITEGSGPLGYTELSPDRLATTRARIGAACTLPYLAGSAPVIAQSYKDETLAYVTYKGWQLICLPALVWILGIIGELFVPALPLNIPRREFGVYSWLALFQSQELQFEAADDLDKLVCLDELEERFSDKRVKFVV